MQNATIRLGNDGAFVLSLATTNVPVRLSVFPEGSAQPALVIELKSGWRTPAQPAGRFEITGSMYSDIAGRPTPVVLILSAPNGIILVEQLTVDGKSLAGAGTTLGTLTQGASTDIAGNDLPEAVGKALAFLRHDPNRIDTDLTPFEPKADKPFVRLVELPRFGEPGNKEKAPLTLLIGRRVRWSRPPNGYNNPRFTLRTAGADRLALYAPDWNLGRALPIPATLAQWSARVGGELVSSIGLFGIPGRGVQEYWNESVAGKEHSARKNDFSTLPLFERVLDSTPTKATPRSVGGLWTVLFTQSAAASGWTPLMVQPLSSVAIRFRLPLIRMHDGSGLTFATRLKPRDRKEFPALDKEKEFADSVGSPSVDDIASWLPHLAVDSGQMVFEASGYEATIDSPADAHEESRLRIGAIDFELDPEIPSVKKNDSSIETLPAIRLHASAVGDKFLSGDLGVIDNTVNVGVVAVQPGGQDVWADITPGSDGAGVEPEFQVTPPLVAPLHSARAAKGLWLEISEGQGLPPQGNDWPRAFVLHATSEAYASGSSKLFCSSSEPSSEQVVVLDASPMVVALVEYPFFLQPIDQQDVVARWLSGTRTWEIGGDASDACLVLPAQALGEDMEKEGTLSGAKENAAIDYRIGRPTRVQLRLGDDVPQVFRKAPWDIKQLFGDPAVPLTQEPVVASIQFEMLYGLPCSADAPNAPGSVKFRLADITRRLGDIPRRMRSSISWTGASTAHSDAFKEARKRWASLYEAYRSRLLLLEPFPDVARYSLDPVVIGESMMKCTVDEPAKVDANSPVAKADSAKLNGGALWGLESAVVFDTIIKSPESVSAFVRGAGFTALGGYGHIESAFDKGLSRIISDVEMGRISEYTVERKGRIGVFWNKCKHVIVYRRTVLPSEQFDPFQPKLSGRPIVRKFAEYIEMEEDVRRFVDRNDGTERQVGFVTGCMFPKGTRINVRSAWGSDVGTIGYQIPLWNPAAAASQPNVYPKPTVSLTTVRAGRHHADAGGAAAGDAGSADATVIIEEPQNLFFFSRVGGDPNSDLWDAVEGIDFVNLPVPAPLPIPQNATSPADVTATSPPENDVPPGFERVTFRVRSDDRGSNLIAGMEPNTDRGASMNARMRSVTMLRGPAGPIDGATTPADDAAREAVSTVATDMEIAHAAVLDVVSRLGDVPGVAQLALDYLTGARKATGDLGAAIDDARARYDAALARLDKTAQLAIAQRAVRAGEVTADKLEKLHATLVETAAIGEKNPWKTTLDDFKDESQDIADRVRVLAGAGPQEVKNFFQHTSLEMLDRLNHMRAVPEPALQQTARLVEVATSLLEQWKRERAEIDTVIVGAVDRPRLQMWVDVWTDRLSATARQIAASRPEWLVTAPAAAAQLLEPFNAAVRAVNDYIAAWDTDKISQAISSAESGVQQRLDAFVAALCPDVDSSIEDVTVRLLSCGAVGQRMKDLSGALAALLPNQGPINDAAKLAADVKNTFEKQLKALQEDAAIKQLKSDVQAKGKQLVQSLNGQAAAGEQLLRQGVESQRNRIEQELKSLAAANTDVVRARIDSLRKEAGTAAGNFAQSVARDLRPLGAQLGGVLENQDKILKLARAFGDPPELSQLGFTHDRLGYYFLQHTDAVGITPVVAQVSRVGAALKSLGMDLPVDKLRERLLPPDLLGQFRLNQIFSNFAGLKLDALFNAINIPESAKDNVRVRHAVDPKALTAWLECSVGGNPKLELANKPASVFNIGPLEMVMLKAEFEAFSRITSSYGGPGGGVNTKQEMRGSIVGDWELRIGGTPMLSFVNTALRFEAPSKLRFEVNPANIRLNEALQFVTDLLKSIVDPASGLSISLTPTGIESILDIAIAPIQIGTTAISNLHIGARFALSFVNGFAIEAGGFLGRRDAPFALTVFVLGGGGYLDVRARYVVDTGELSCNVSLGISAAASVGIALGPIRGGVFVSLGYAVDFASGGENRGLRVGIVFVIRGEVSVLGIIDVCLTLYLEASYSTQDKVIRGTGRVSLRIKICWCFTLKVSAQVTYTLGCDPSGDGHHALPAARVTPEEIDRLAGEYIGMLI